MEIAADYTKSDIVDSLRKTGIIEGDSIFIHSNIGFFGRLHGAKNYYDHYKIFKSAIFEVIGEHGTLVVPTFSHSFFLAKEFNKNTTPSICGFLSETIRRDSDSKRSDDPNFSIAAIGENAEYFTKNTPDNPFGKGCFWEKFLDVGGKFCNFNFDSASTFVHYVERLLQVPYRYDKPFTGVLINERKVEERTFYHFVYDHSKKNHAPHFGKFGRIALKEGVTRTANLGKGQVTVISTKDTFLLITEQINKDPAFLIKGPL